MIERVCQQCQHGNPLENRFCGRCGLPLERQLPAPTQQTALAVAGRNLPVPWKHVGQTLAMGLAALAAEAGVAWLRRKVEQVTLPPAPAPGAARPLQAIVPTSPRTAPAGETITISSQRVIEVWDQGTLTRQVVERTQWRKESS